MLQSLNTEEKCREYLEELRWHGEPICPHCGSISKHHYKLTQNGEFKGLYKCKDCRKRFTITIGGRIELLGRSRADTVDADVETPHEPKMFLFHMLFLPIMLN